MEWVVVSGVAVCVILMGVTVFLTAKSARKNERRLRKMEEEIGEWIESQSAGQTAGSAALKAELGIQLEQSVRVLGELLSSGQQTASAANSASIAALERQLFTS